MPLNDLDLIFMSIEQLQPELSVWSGLGRREIARRVRAARALIKVRRDLEVHYLPKSMAGFIGPCLCVHHLGRHCCRVCRRLL
jgi:hypothetical protein